MEIKTKFNYGQKVYVLQESGICIYEVVEIDVKIHGESDVDVKYHLEAKKGTLDCKESRVFASREDLIASL